MPRDLLITELRLVDIHVNSTGPHARVSYDWCRVSFISGKRLYGHGYVLEVRSCSSACGCGFCMLTSPRSSVTNLPILGVGWDWVHLIRRPLTGLLYQPRMIDECGAVGGMRIGKGNRNTRKKPVPMPLCPPQIPHDLTWARTRAAAVGSRRLTSWATARPS
jgi:hypothetical protein